MQQVEDIEAVRQDMQKRGKLPQDGKIMLYGGSGGGFLVQQYLDRYGEHVSRALIECSGGPDLAATHNTTFMKKTCQFNESLDNSGRDGRIVPAHRPDLCRLIVGAADIIDPLEEAPQPPHSRPHADRRVCP
jgi:pimeloyl-ACP methyl ester carboxylesterase